MELKNKKLEIGVLLPHTKIYGGVKRYLEIGNCFKKSGHNFTIFTEDGSFSNWFPYLGKIRKHKELNETLLDVLFFSQTDFLPFILKSSAKRKIFYIINPQTKLSSLLKHPQIEFFANSKGIKIYTEKKYKISAFAAFGGINLSLFKYKLPIKKRKEEPFIVMAYGRISKPKKGSLKVVKACERLYKKGHNIHLLLFDSPTDALAEKTIQNFHSKVPYDFILNHPVDKNAELFHRSNVFVSAETSGGWSNTSAEAMASGTPVIATNVGTQDFLINMETGILLSKSNSKHIEKTILLLMNDYELRRVFSQRGRKQIENFGWEVLTKNILKHLLSNNDVYNKEIICK